MTSSTTTAIVATEPHGGTLTATLPGADRPVTIPCTRDVSATAIAGDQILVTIDGSQLWATGVLGDAPAVQPDTAPGPDSTGQGPEDAGATGRDALRPIWAGTWDGSWRDDLPDMGCGAAPQWGVTIIRSGAAFYGPGLRGYGQLTRAWATLTRNSGGVFGGVTIPMRLLAGDGYRPGSYPTVLATATGPTLTVGAEADWELPGDWLARLGPDGDAGGIGIGNGSQDPYARIASPLLTFDWRK